MSSSSSPTTTTPRQLLTSLLNAIGDIPLPQEDGGPGQPQQPQGYATLNKPVPSNPLGLIHPSHRPLFTTLHVLFPSLLLPALDLLDRGLATRLVVQQKIDTAVGQARERKEGALPQSQEEQAGSHEQRRCLYLVRSAQTTTARRPYGGGGGFSTTEMPTGQAYVVHAEAWNCTCAAFAFAAFPVLGSPVTASGPGLSSLGEGKGKQVDLGRPGDDTEKELETATMEAELGWQFGGMSFDGTVGEGSDGVPCCKHLLACVLAERWPAGLGRYVAERTVTKEEMAGIVADV